MEDCIFCNIVRGEAPSWKVFENDSVYAFLDINPVNPWHTLVIPKRHHVNVFDTPAETLQEVIAVVKELTTLYRERLGIEHVQIINSSGAEAQQDVFHLHFHIVPRRYGDGQQIRWHTKPELRTQFDQMLEQLK